jgi:glycosyltransferase involved in cell wall biosynthesis
MQTLKKLSVILPVYNEVKSLQYVIDNWHKFLKDNSIEHEFVVCEDGSNDGTKELISRIKSNYPIIDQSVEFRRGYGGGVISGIKSATFDHILCIDSDGQCMPDSFFNFIKNYNLTDIIIGCRKKRKDPVLRLIYSGLFKIIFNLLFNNKIKDPSCPYILFNKSVFTILETKLTYMKEGFWWGFVGAATMSNIKFHQIDIIHYKRYDGNSVVYKLSRMPEIIIRNIIGLIKLKNSFNK